LSSESVDRRKLIWALTIVSRDELDEPPFEGLCAPARPGGRVPLMDDVDL
jgi:hypothetical protein